MNVNVPNALTFLRIFLSVFFALPLIFYPSSGGILVSLALFLLASATDYWDGVIARTHNQITAFGKLMDPIADKFLVLSAFFIFAWKGIIPFWSIAVIAARDLVVTLQRLRLPSNTDGRSARSSGKNKTIVQYVFIVAVLLCLLFRQNPRWNDGWNVFADVAIRWTMYFVVAVTVWTGVRFILKSRHAIRRGGSVG